MDPENLDRALAEAFDASERERRGVVRQATDLRDSGQYARDQGHPLTAAEVVAHLQDAPDEGLADRWNWWLGALEVAYGSSESEGSQEHRTVRGDYAAFQLRRWQA